MIFWNIKNLTAQLKSNDLTGSQSINYLLGLWILIAALRSPIELLTFFLRQPPEGAPAVSPTGLRAPDFFMDFGLPVVFFAVSVVVASIALQKLYEANGRKGGRDFLGRILSLSFVHLIRNYMLVMCSFPILYVVYRILGLDLLNKIHLYNTFLVYYWFSVVSAYLSVKRSLSEISSTMQPD